MFGHDAVILDWHHPAAEIDHARAEFDVRVEEWCFLGSCKHGAEVNSTLHVKSIEICCPLKVSSGLSVNIAYVWLFTG
jgi:hypothetical protein